MPAAWPATHRIRPTKKRIPGTVDGPKHIGYYLEPLRGIASKPGPALQQIMRQSKTFAA